MKKHGHKIAALIKKDFIYCAYNQVFWCFVAIAILLAILIDLIYLDAKDLGAYRTYMHLAGVLAGAVMVGPSMLSLLIAEEKEKNTFRTLLLSNIKCWEFIISKSIVIFIFTEITSIFIFMLTGHSIQSICLLSFLIAVLMIPFTFSGIIIGLCSKNQMTANTFSSVTLIIFYIFPIIGTIGEVKPLYLIARFSPATSLIELYFSITNVQYIENALTYGFLSTNLFSWLVIIFWSVSLCMLFVFTYRKQRFDDTNTHLLVNRK